MQEKSNYKKTIRKEVLLKGKGLFYGEEVILRFLPLEEGLTHFVRIDHPDKPVIPASIEFASHRYHSTVLERNGVEVKVVEHVLAAIYGLGIDLVKIEINGEEPPVLDGSALPIAESLMEAGLVEVGEKKEEWEPDSPFVVGEKDSYLLVTWAENCKFGYFLDFPHPLLNSLYYEFVLTPENFLKEIAPARTFGFLDEVEPLRKKGLYKGGNLQNTVVLDRTKILNDSLRYPDEFVRHKILDLLGDFYLSGRYLKKGFIKGVKSGHGTNLKLARRVKGRVNMEKVMEIEEIMKILPHRYPFLFVDRILFLGEKKAVGMKNLTMNEEFFQGHFPGYPIMPAVIMLEAMAQVGGVLLLSKTENQGKIAYFAGVENARFRKPVKPGDQLITEVEIIRLKKRVGRVRAVATVAGEKVAEAEFLFSLAER